MGGNHVLHGLQSLGETIHVWKILALGQDRECLRARTARKGKAEVGIAYCEACESLLPDIAFDHDTKLRLANGLPGLVQCEACACGESGLSAARLLS